MSKIFLSITFFLVLNILYCFPSFSKPVDSVELRLSTYSGKTQLEHNRNYPLLLKVIVSTMGEPVTIENFKVVVKSNDSLLTAKQIPSEQKNSKAQIDKNNSIFLQFGLEPEELKMLKNKSVNLTAKIEDSQCAKLLSNELKIVLSDSSNSSSKSVESLIANYDAGSFYLLKKRFDKVEEYAKTLEQIAPSLAWDLRGDAFLGQNKKAEAKKAFRESLKSIDVELPEQMREITNAKYREIAD